MVDDHIKNDPNKQYLVPYEGPLPTGEELEQVRERIRWLRKLVRDPKYKENPEWRRATSLEAAVAQADRKPHHCMRNVSRSGLPCSGPRIRGGTVCIKHGGTLPQVKKKARHRLTMALDATIGRLEEIRDQNDHLPSAVAAAKAIMDRVLPALTREDGPAKPQGPTGPIIQVGVVLSGVEPRVQVSAGNTKAKASLPAARDAAIVDGECAD